MSVVTNRKFNRVHFSHAAANWVTPSDVFLALDMEFNFTLDPCADACNTKCVKYFTKQENGLTQDWGTETVFMNPPYGREISKWLKKAYESSRGGASVVCLIPARTDTRWWHEYVMKGEIRLIKGRLKFSGHKTSAPFPSAVVIFKAAV